jgi:hypothetical protein
MGWVFTPRHFLDLASRPAVTSALRRQISAGTIRQLSRGLYDYPKLHTALGPLAPTPEALAKALAGRDRVRLQPSVFFNNLILAERVGFEPTCRLPDNTLSRRARYDHFGTSPHV